MEDEPETAANRLFDDSDRDDAEVDNADPGEEVADDGAGEDGDEDGDDRRGISLGTKVLVIASAWVLLTLFLIGQFNGDDDPVDRSLTFEQGVPTTLPDDPAESADGEVVEAVDEDGDGEIEPGEPGYATASTLTGAAATGSGSAGSGDSDDDGGSGDAEPVLLPGGSTTTTTTTKSAASTTSPPSQTSTTTTESTSTTADSQPLVTFSGSTCQFSPDGVDIASGETVYFRNDTGATKTLKLGTGSEKLEIANGETGSHAFTTDTLVRCDAGNSGSVYIDVQ